jgi:hypothetical protein
MKIFERNGVDLKREGEDKRDHMDGLKAEKVMIFSGKEGSENSFEFGVTRKFRKQ